MAALSGGSTNLDWSSKVGLITFAPSIAYRLNDMLSVRRFAEHQLRHIRSFHLRRFDPAASSTSGSTPRPRPAGAWERRSECSSNPIRWSVSALVYRTASKVKLLRHGGDVQAAAIGAVCRARTWSATITWPAWLAGGVAFMPTDRLTITADVQYTNWKTIQSHRHDLPGLDLVPADDGGGQRISCS